MPIGLVAKNAILIVARVARFTNLGANCFTFFSNLRICGLNFRNSRLTFTLLNRIVKCKTADALLRTGSVRRSKDDYRHESVSDFGQNASRKGHPGSV